MKDPNTIEFGIGPSIGEWIIIVVILCIGGAGVYSLGALIWELRSVIWELLS